MEIKKHNHANLERTKNSLFLFGLLVSSGSLLMAFEWVNFEQNYVLPEAEIGELVEYEPAVKEIIIEQPKPKQPRVQKQSLIIDDVEIKPITEEDPKPFINIESPPLEEGTFVDTTLDFGGAVKTPIIEGFTRIPEIMPEYPGGMAALYKDLGERIRENNSGQGGKVYVDFIVEKDGSISNVEIRKGINPLLDAKSINAVKNLKNWAPGEQNYHPVRVKMTLPINYVIR